jgi:SAM-dependent methyltransferase
VEELMAASRPSLVRRAVRRLIRPHGSVVRQGEFVTFRPEGFVEAKDPGSLLCRHYYEVKQLRRCLALAADHGVNPGRSLEIGCGFGRLSPYIAEHFEQHTAVDINSWAVSQASEYYPAISFSVGSATELPFANSTFDTVITWTVLQHIPNSLVGKALSEINRVANPPLAHHPLRSNALRRKAGEGLATHTRSFPRVLCGGVFPSQAHPVGVHHRTGSHSLSRLSGPLDGFRPSIRCRQAMNVKLDSFAVERVPNIRLQREACDR